MGIIPCGFGAWAIAERLQLMPTSTNQGFQPTHKSLPNQCGCNGRGCTPEFSHGKAKERRYGSTRAGQAASHFYPGDKLPIFIRLPQWKLTPVILLSPYYLCELTMLAMQSQGDFTCVCNCKARIATFLLPVEKNHCQPHKTL